MFRGGQQAGKSTGRHILGGETEDTWDAHFGEEEADRCPQCSAAPRGGEAEGGASSAPGTDGWVGMHKAAPGEAPTGH